MPLIPCPSCHRHVRVADTACPFCSSSLPEGARPVPSATTRLGRGALFAFAVSVAACGGTTESEPATDGGGTDTGATKDSGSGDTSVTDTGTLSGAYGSPPPDTGVRDTGVTDTGSPAPPYGIPPSDGG